jgi:tetratricopeptide (TPR) repeat protein
MAVAHSNHGWLLAQLGRTDEAIAAARRAVDLDPLDPGTHTNLGSMYVYGGQIERGVEAYRASLVLEDHVITYFNLALSYAELHRDREALAAAERARELAPDHMLIGVAFAYAHARAGRPAEAERHILPLEALPEPPYYLIASVYAGLGEGERALALLERAVAAQEPNVADMGVDPAFAAYRDDPRLQAMLNRLGVR